MRKLLLVSLIGLTIGVSAPSAAISPVNIKVVYQQIILDKTTEADLTKSLGQPVNIQVVTGPPYGTTIIEAFGSLKEGLVVYLPTKGKLKNKVVAAVYIKDNKLANKKFDKTILKVSAKKTSKSAI